MPRFQPTEEQRETVRALVAAGKTKEFIARAIINPLSERPIGIRTLMHYFARELNDATVELLVLFYRNLKKGLEAGERWATEYAGDNLTQLKALAKDPAAAEPVKQVVNQIIVRGVASPHANDPRPGPINITPAPLWPKSIEHQPTPPREPPIIDSREEGFIKPLVTEVPQPNEPEPYADMGEALFKPLNGTYRNEVDITLEKRKLDMSPGAVQRRAERLRAWKR
jgi:hypothetical protein